MKWVYFQIYINKNEIKSPWLDTCYKTERIEYVKGMSFHIYCIYFRLIWHLNYCRRHFTETYLIGLLI